MYGRASDPGMGHYPSRVRQNLNVVPSGNYRRALAYNNVCLESGGNAKNHADCFELNFLPVYHTSRMIKQLFRGGIFMRTSSNCFVLGI